MTNLKRAGYALLVLSLLGLFFSGDLRYGALARYSGAALAISFVLVLASVLSSLGPGAGRSVDAQVKNILKEFAPFVEGGAQDLSSGVPSWAYLTGGIAFLLGSAGFVAGPNGVNTWSVSTSVLALAGLLFIPCATLVYGEPVARRNLLRGAVALVSFLAMIAGIYLSIMIIVDAFDEGRGPRYWPHAAALFVFGFAGVYYGLSRQHSSEGRAIGRKLGFADADGSDGVYDSKGMVNGLEVLLDVDQKYPYKGVPERFRLEVLCRCANTRKVSLLVRPSGPLGGLAAGFLPRVPDVPRWEGFVVRCDQPDALGALSEARRPGSVFDPAAGFEEMSLDGRNFRFVFDQAGYLTADFARAAADAASRLAARFH